MAPAAGGKAGFHVAVLCFIFMLIAALFSLQISPATAKDGQCPAPDVRNDVRPDADDVPTHVSMGLRLVDLTTIDDVNQSMTVDFAIFLSWKDPRLSELAGCVVPISSVWDPGIVFFNSCHF